MSTCTHIWTWLSAARSEALLASIIDRKSVV